LGYPNVITLKKGFYKLNIDYIDQRTDVDLDIQIRKHQNHIYTDADFKTIGSQGSGTYLFSDSYVKALKDKGYVSDEDADAVIFSKGDLTINGSGTLNIDAKKNNGIKANDSLHMTGGTYKISSVGDAFNVNDELNITGTTMTIEAEEDGVKVDNDDDTSVGTMYLSDNTMTIKAGDDGIHASGDLIIDSGTYKV